MTVLRKVLNSSATFTVNLSLGFQRTRGKFCDSSYCRGQQCTLSLPSGPWCVPVVIPMVEIKEYCLTTAVKYEGANTPSTMTEKDQI